MTRNKDHAIISKTNSKSGCSVHYNQSSIVNKVPHNRAQYTSLGGSRENQSKNPNRATGGKVNSGFKEVIIPRRNHPRVTMVLHGFSNGFRRCIVKSPLNVQKDSQHTPVFENSPFNKVDNLRKSSVSAKAPTKTMLMRMKRVRLKGGVFHFPVDKPLQSFKAERHKGNRTKGTTISIVSFTHLRNKYGFRDPPGGRSIP